MQNQRIRIRLKAFDHRLINRGNRRDCQAHWCAGPWSDPAADTQRALHCSDLPARQQRRARSVRNPYSLASG